MNSSRYPSGLILCAVLCAAFLYPVETLASGQETGFALRYYWGSLATNIVQSEGDGPQFFLVTAPPGDSSRSVEYRLVSGSAAAGEDFVQNAGRFTFGPGEMTKQLVIDVIDDGDTETDETFEVRLFNPSGGEILTPSVPFTIQDDERGTYAIWNASGGTEGEAIEVYIAREGDYRFTSSVEAYLIPGSAQPGVHYVDEVFNVTLGPGEQVKTVRIRLLDDTEEQVVKRLFRIALRNPSGGLIIGQRNSWQLGINDNETGYAVHRSRHQEWEGDFYEGGENYFMLERNGDYDVETSVAVSVRELTPEEASPDHLFRAVAGEDFVAETIQVTFAPGQKRARVPLHIINDNRIEPSVEHLAIVHARSQHDTNPVVNFAEVRDNDFALLPASPICLPQSLDPSVVMNIKAGGVLVAGSVSETSSKLFKLEPDGTLDPEFANPEVSGRILSVWEASDGEFLVSLHIAQDRFRLVRLLASGMLDDSFPAEESTRAALLSPCLGGKWFVARGNLLVRLNNDWSLDMSFPPLEFSEIYRVTADPLAGVHVNAKVDDPHPLLVLGCAGCNSITRDWDFTSAGMLDPSYKFRQSIFLDGVPYEYRTTGGRFLMRLLASGDIDPAFTPIPAYEQEIVRDPQGRFYRFQEEPQHTGRLLVTRFLQDGLPDTTFLTGALCMYGDGSGVFLNEKELLVKGAGGVSMDGLSSHCDGGIVTLARINLDPDGPRVQLEPDRNVLYERSTGIPQKLTIIRSGDLSQPSEAITYRVHEGTALPGRDFQMALEGRFTFAPGVSHAFVEVTPLENFEPGNRSFYLELLAPDESLLERSKITILNDDIVPSIVREQSGWCIDASEGEDGLSFVVKTSTDLKNWEWFGPTTIRPGMSQHIYDGNPIWDRARARFFRLDEGNLY